MQEGEQRSLCDDCEAQVNRTGVPWPKEHKKK
jgi:hypothetical protein